MGVDVAASNNNVVYVVVDNQEINSRKISGIWEDAAINAKRL